MSIKSDVYNFLLPDCCHFLVCVRDIMNNFLASNSANFDGVWKQAAWEAGKCL
jgi:hypothetical protein